MKLKCKFSLNSKKTSKTVMLNCSIFFRIVLEAVSFVICKVGMRRKQAYTGYLEIGRILTPIFYP